MSQHDEPSIHSQIGHYTGVLRELVNLHHILRSAGTCAEHGEAAPAPEVTIKAVESTIGDAARLVSKLLGQAESQSGVRAH